MVKRTFPGRFNVFLVNPDPTGGHEIRKPRPAVVISPDELNEYLSTVLIAPMTTQRPDYPTPVARTFEGKDGWVVLDQIRTMDKACLVRNLGEADNPTQADILSGLSAMFEA